MSRRSVLASLAVGGAAVGYAAGQAGDLDDGTTDSLYAAGIPNLTSQYERSKYFAAPSSVFDKSAMETGQAAIVTDDFGLAVKDEDGNMEVPPFGSSTTPVPSATIEVLSTISRSADRIIYADSGTYTAVGNDSVIDEGSTAHTVINNAIPARTAGPKRRQLIQLKGDFDMVGDVTLPSHTALDLTSAYLKVDPSYSGGGDLIDGSAGIQNSMIIGGYIDGNRDNVSPSVEGIRLDNPASSTAFGSGGDNLIFNTRIQGMTGNGIVDASRRDTLWKLVIADCDLHGVQLTGTDIKAWECRVRDVSFNAWRVIRPHCHLYGCIGENSLRGLYVDGGAGGDTILVDGGFYENNGKEGIKLDAVANSKITPFEVIANGRDTDGDQAGISVVNGNNNWLVDMLINDPNGTPTQEEAILLDADCADNIVRDVQHHDNPQGITDNGTRNEINGTIQEALGGSAPGTPANYRTGVVVEDTDNAGDAYLKLPSSGFSQIST